MVRKKRFGFNKKCEDSPDDIIVYLQYSYPISDDNMKNIKKHLNKVKEYQENICNQFSINYKPEIYYFIPLGGISRSTIEEKEKLNEIKNFANNIFYHLIRFSLKYPIV